MRIEISYYGQKITSIALRGAAQKDSKIAMPIKQGFP